MVRSRLKHLDDIASELQVIDKVGLRATPIGLVNEFLERKRSLLAVARQAIVDAQGGFAEIGIKLGPGHHGKQGKEQ